MTPRPRKDPDLPDNLRRETRRGRVEFRYTHPVTGKRYRFGTNKAKAVEAARLLNGRLSGDNAGALVGRVEGREEGFSAFLTIYERDILPTFRHKRTGLPYSDKTLAEYRRMLKQIRGRLGDWPTPDIDRRQVTDFLAEYPTVMSNRYRTLLSSVFKYAVARGWAEHSPVADTIAQTEVVERVRLTWEDYETIHKAAPEWFKRALEGGIVTLQPRQVLAAMRFEDEADGWLYVVRGKTKGKGHGYIRIKVTPEIRQWLQRCRDSLLSPFVIHREPARRRREYMNQKAHWTAVTPEMLTREFKRIRDKEGVRADLEPSQRPTFHELRGLGADLYRQQGVPDAAIQRLMGHASGRMTRTYLDGHGVRWMDADMGGETG